ncbi:MAG: hypothetical protein RL189_2329 [Pseudomonadota bacterium]
MNLRQLPRLLKIFAGVVGSFVVLVLGIVVAIRSPFVMNRILPPIQNRLEKDFNLKTKISQLSIDPFARVAVQGVSAEWTDPQMGKAKVDVESVLVSFSFWELLKRNLQVSAIEVVSPRISGELILPQSSESQSPSNPLPMIKNLLMNPPASVNLSSFSVRGLSMDVKVRQGKLLASAKLDGFSLTASLRLVMSQLNAGLKFSLGNASDSLGRIKLEAKNVAPDLPLVFLDSDLSLSGSADTELSFTDPASPFFSISGVSLDILARALQTNLKMSKAAQADVTLAELKVSSRLPEIMRLSLSDIYQLEKLSGEEFASQLPAKFPQLIKQISLSADAELQLKGLKAAARMPASGIDSAVRLNAELPLQIKLTPDEILVSSASDEIKLDVEELKLKGSAFQSLNQNIKTDILAGLRVNTPLRLSMKAPSLNRKNKLLDGARLVSLSLEPEVAWGIPSQKLVSAKVNLNHDANGLLGFKAESEIFVKERLFALMPALKTVADTLGQLRIQANLDTALSTQWRDLQGVVDSMLAGVRKVTLDYKVNIEQLTLPPKNSPMALQLAGGVVAFGRAEIPQPSVLKDVSLTADVEWAGAPLLKNKLSISNLPKRLVIKGETDIAALLRLRKITPLAEQLGMLGGTLISAKWLAALPHEAATILQAKLPPPERMSADATVDAELRFAEKPVKPVFDKNILQIAGPLKAKLQTTLSRGTINLVVDYNLPKAGLPELALVDGLKGRVNARAKLDLQGGVDVTLQSDIAAVTPSKALNLPEEVLPYLNSITAKLELQSDSKSRVDIRSGIVSTGKDKFRVNFRGGTDIKATNSRFDGQLSVVPPKVFKYGIRAQDKVSLDGSVQVAWELTQKEQKAVRLRGEASLENFSAQHQLGGMRNATGRIPFQQELELPNFKSLRWSYLIQDNPFKRVDASKFVPLLSEDSFLVIDELNALEKKFGPLRGRFSLKQNMLTIDRLDADVFEGVLAGQGFVDIQPTRLMAGLQGRVTKLNTALLAAKPEKASPAPLSARLALVVDLSKALVEGRVDVTEIGKNQLLAMTDLLDPTGGDALLNKARLALSAGYPTYVGMQMQQGFLDLDIGIGGLVTQQLKIPHLPLTPIINAKTQDIVKTLREVPIQ